MFRRWLIRSFFFGLLLLGVGGWLLSYVRLVGIYGSSRHFFGSGPQCLAMEPFRGSIYVAWFEYNQGSGLICEPFPFHHSVIYFNSISAFGGWQFLGFGGITNPPNHMVQIPFWFPTTLSALLLLIVWRKTARPKPGRAFPVEMQERSGVPASSKTGGDAHAKT